MSLNSNDRIKLTERFIKDLQEVLKKQLPDKEFSIKSLIEERGHYSARQDFSKCLYHDFGNGFDIFIVYDPKDLTSFHPHAINLYNYEQAFYNIFLFDIRDIRSPSFIKRITNKAMSFVSNEIEILEKYTEIIIKQGEVYEWLD